LRDFAAANAAGCCLVISAIGPGYSGKWNRWVMIRVYISSNIHT